MSIREAIWGDENPYPEGPAQYDLDLQGWRTDHPVLNEAAKTANAIVEVGVWKGCSVAEMAAVNPQAEILAVDTFRGSAEHWLKDKWQETVHGDIYGLFKSNMIRSEIEDRVTPLPLDSRNAWIICKHKGLGFDLAHIDGGHDLLTVYGDLRMWAMLVRSGGVIVADDVGGDFPEVDQAVQRFCLETEWKIGKTVRGKALLVRNGA